MICTCLHQMTLLTEDVSDPRITDTPDVQEFWICKNPDCPNENEPVLIWEEK